MTLLVLSLCALALGPWLVAVTRLSPSLEPGVDAFVAVSIGGLVLLDIVPESYREVGWIALAAAFVGAVIPWLVHRWWHERESLGERLLVGAAIVGLAAHGVLDGLALRSSGDNAQALGVAVVVHQAPLGAGLWWLFVSRFGRLRTILVFVVLGAATVAGFALMPLLAAHSSARFLVLGQALLAGSLLHVVVEHRPDLSAGKSASSRWLALLGALIGAVVVFLVWRLDA